MSNRGKQQQTIVQNVTMGSPAFMAGLHQGDAIIEINGEDVRHASPDEIVDKIMTTKEPRVHLIVEFLDGVRRNNLRRKQSELKQLLVRKQEELKKVLSSNNCLTSHRGITRPPSDCMITVNLSDEAGDSPVHKTTNTAVLTPSSPDNSISNVTNKLQLVLYTGDILRLTCDILVIPLGSPVVESSSCTDEIDNGRVMTKLLHAGGDKLINELSLSPYCQLGGVISTSGGKLQGIKNIYHCVFGSTDEHIVKCFKIALERAVSGNEAIETGVAFWVDGFFALNVSPYKVIEILSQVTLNSTVTIPIIIASATFSDLHSVVTDVFHKCANNNP